MPNFYILNVKNIKSVSNFLIQNFSERQNLSWNTLFLNMLEACLILRRKFYLCALSLSRSLWPPDQVPELGDLQLTPGVQLPAHLLGDGQAPDVGSSLVLGPGNREVYILIKENSIFE